MVRTWLAACALALASCRSFDFSSQRMWLRHVPEEDALDLVLSYEGVDAVRDVEKTTEATVGHLEGIAAGDRHLILFDWPLEFDLEELSEDLRDAAELEKLVPGASEELLAALEGISVESRLFVSGRGPGELCLLQRWRVEGATELLRLLERIVEAVVINESLEDVDHENPRKREQAERWRAHAGKGWFRFDGRDFLVTVPMSAAEGAEFLRELGTGDQADWSPVFDALTGVTLADGVLALRFAPGEDGWIHVEARDPENAYLPGVAARLVEGGVAGTADLEESLSALLSD